MSNAKILDELFTNLVENKGVFKNKSVLRHDYLPSRLPHREEQIRLLGEKVAPSLKKERCSNIFIYGKTGTGKTAVTKYVLSHLEIKAKEYASPLKFCYVNCRMAGSRYRVLTNLCENVGVTVPFTGLAMGELFHRFVSALDLSQVIFIAVLDEIDALVKECEGDLLYELTRINEMLNRSNLSLIGISNDLRLKEYLDPRVFSSLSEEEIVFRPYDAAELRNILSERAKEAFRENALDESALNLCAALAAAEHGDARRALDLLRVSGEVAERAGVPVVTEDHVREAEKHIEHNRVAEALKDLTLHSQLVILSLFHLDRAGVSSAITGEIYEVYGDLCKEIGLAPLTQRRLGTIVNELDAMGLLNAKVISMGRYGRTKKIKLEITRGLIKEVFDHHVRLGRLIDYVPECLQTNARSRSR